MFKVMKGKIVEFLLEIIITCFTAVGVFIWGLHTTNASQEIEINVLKVRTEKIEEHLECLRKENREDHKEILMELRK